MRGLAIKKSSFIIIYHQATFLGSQIQSYTDTEKKQVIVWKFCMQYEV